MLFWTFWRPEKYLAPFGIRTPRPFHILTKLPWLLHLAVLCIQNNTVFSLYPYFHYIAWFHLFLEIKKNCLFCCMSNAPFPKMQHQKSPLTYTEPIICIWPTFLFHSVTLLHESICGPNLIDWQDNSAAGTLGSTEIRWQSSQQHFIQWWSWPTPRY